MVYHFYRFTTFPDYRQWRLPLHTCCARSGLLGTVLLAPEGINAMLSGPRQAVRELVTMLARDERFTALPLVSSGEATPRPFRRLKVKAVPELVRLDEPGSRLRFPVPEGLAVEPSDWDSLLDDPQVRVLDLRNDYETCLGGFAGAEAVATRSFSQFPAWVNGTGGMDKGQRIAMYCTGGIRCEKATAWLLSRGHGPVHFLKGGILAYLAWSRPASSRWRGQCFVFDRRQAPGKAEPCPS